jgi:hypothetical protein
MFESSFQSIKINFGKKNHSRLSDTVYRNDIKIKIVYQAIKINRDVYMVKILAFYNASFGCYAAERRTDTQNAKN